MRFRFAGYTLDADRRELRRGPELVAVEPQVFDLLIHLVENRHRVVSKDDLIASVWGGRIVSDSTLTSRLNAARKAIGDTGGDQRLIRTIARKGLRFIGEASVDEGADEAFSHAAAGRRKLAALLVADVVNYGRLVGADEERTLARLRALRSDLIDPTLALHHGRVVKRTGDGLVAEFRSVVDAVRAAVEVQSAMDERNAGLAPEARIDFRVGVHLGDVVEEADGDLMGDGVNIAARLEAICEPGKVYLSAAAYDQAPTRLRETFCDLGERSLKNIDRPVRVYASNASRANAAAVARAPERTSSPAPAERPAIAVLPFENMSGDPEQDYFSDGISEDIITALSKLRWFFVIARNSSFTYKRKTVHLKQIGEELGVGYVVEGSVRKGGDRVRITAQLNDVATGGPIWAERYDRSLADVFAVQDEITEAVVAAIEPQLYAAENFRASRKPPESLDAWELVMRALSHYWRVTRQDHLVAQALLEKATAIDPNYGQAAGLLAATHMFCAHMGWEDMDVATPLAERAALAAIAADNDDPWAHLALGNVHLMGRRQFDDALAEMEWVVRLNPNFSMGQGYYGLALCYAGRWQDGFAAVSRALRLSPRDPLAAIYCGIAAYAQFIARNYDEAMRFARQGVRQRPDFVGAHRVLTASAAMAGQTDVAAEALKGLRRAQPNISLAWIEKEMPIRDAAERAHYVEAFRRAGME